MVIGTPLRLRKPIGYKDIPERFHPLDFPRIPLPIPLGRDAQTP